MKSRRSQTALWTAAVVLSLAMIYYYYGLLIPLRQKAFRLANSPAGNWSDLYPRWLGTRELLLHGRNPYSPEVTREIQRGFYGRPLDATNSKDPSDPEAFAYPLYVVFLLAPFVHFSFAVVSAAFTALLFLLTLASVLLWRYALDVRLTARALLLAAIALVTSYPVLDGLHLQQLTLLVAAMLAAALAALAAHRPFLAGVLLACATIKPQLVVVLAVGLLLWSVAAFRQRKSFLAGFAAALFLLLAGAQALLPGWFGMWRQAAASYLTYVRPSLLGGILGRQPAQWMGGVAVVGSVFLFWQFRRHGPDSQHFALAVISALLVTSLIAPNSGNAKYNLVLLIPACLWLFDFGLKLKLVSPLGHLGWLLAVNGLVWQWGLALLTVAAVVIFRHPLQREATLLAAAPEILVFYFPLVLLPFLFGALVYLHRAEA